MTAVHGLTPDVIERLAAPPPVLASLRRLRDELQRAAGENLVTLAIYGGLARGRFRPGHSDINLLVVLKDGSTSALDALAQPLRTAFRSARVEPFLLTVSELAGATDVFPTKLLDIQAHHVVIAGQDPFGSLQVSREHIRLRIEQELRNLGLRLRRQYVTRSDDDASLLATLARVAVPLSVELSSLLRLTGKTVPSDDSPAGVFEGAAAAFGLDAEALADVAALKDGQSVSRAAPELYGRILATVTRAAERVDALEVGDA
ncbi:MAG TPA: nucleotidyltransferase domain-containing protein [Myxococcaceae bacterium]|nr:nucleotidyltransferase domain-containing protein [Myxococcaceae bacterium]